MKANYKRMLQGMQSKAADCPEMWHLYILECADGSYYTGIAKDIDQRFTQHQKGKGARYTRSRTPLTLIYRESCESRSAALIRECQVKALSKQAKIELVRQYKEPE